MNEYSIILANKYLHTGEFSCVLCQRDF